MRILGAATRLVLQDKSKRYLADISVHKSRALSKSCGQGFKFDEPTMAKLMPRFPFCTLPACTCACLYLCHKQRQPFSICTCLRLCESYNVAI